MAGFKFRLATLERLRQAQRDERQAELSQAQHAHETVVRQRDEIDVQLTDIARFCRDAIAPGALSLDRLLDAQRYELVLRAERAMMERNLLLLTAEVEKRRAALIEANRELRVLEKLRETQLLNYLAAQNRREMMLLDEAALRQVGAESSGRVAHDAEEPL